VVPLDLFPSGIIASSLVQKSYSVNYPGEFGGGVINLTTRAVPQDPLHHDLREPLRRWRDDRPVRLFLLRQQVRLDRLRQRRARYAAGAQGLPGQRRADQLRQGRYRKPSPGELVRPIMPPCRRTTGPSANFSFNITAGKAFPKSETAVSASSPGQAQQQMDQPRREAANLAAGRPGGPGIRFPRVTTQNRMIVNGLFGLASNSATPTSTRFAGPTSTSTTRSSRRASASATASSTTVDYMQQDTAWYERQLIDTQFVGEFKPTEDLSEPRPPRQLRQIRSGMRPTSCRSNTSAPMRPPIRSASISSIA
jgi:hypothetical protein